MKDESFDVIMMKVPLTLMYHCVTNHVCVFYYHLNLVWTNLVGHVT